MKMNNPRLRITLITAAMVFLSIGFASAACYLNDVEEDGSEYEDYLNVSMNVSTDAPYTAEMMLTDDTQAFFPDAAVDNILLNVPADQIESVVDADGNEWEVNEVTGDASDFGAFNTSIEPGEDAEVSPTTINITFADTWDQAFPRNDEGYLVAAQISNIGEAGDDSAWVTIGFCDEETPLDGTPADENETVTDNETIVDENVTDNDTIIIIDENVTDNETIDDENVTDNDTIIIDGNETTDNETIVDENETAEADCYLNIVQEDKSQYEGQLNASVMTDNETNTAEIELTNDTLETFQDARISKIQVNAPVELIENVTDSEGNELEFTEIDVNETNDMPFGEFLIVITALMSDELEHDFGDFQTEITVSETGNATGPITITYTDEWDGTIPVNEQGYAIAALVENIGDAGNDSAWITCKGEGITTCYLNVVQPEKIQYDGQLNATMLINNETTPYFANIELTDDTLEAFPDASLASIMLNVPADQINSVSDESGNWTEVEDNETGQVMFVKEEAAANITNQTDENMTGNMTNQTVEGLNSVVIHFEDTWDGMLPPNTEGYVIAVNVQNIGEMGNDSAWITLGFCEVANETAQEMDIVDTAIDAGSFDTLVLALQEANLTETLRGEGPFTVFAPTDEAFDALPEGTLEELLQDPENLTAVLTYHVVPGEYMASDIAGMESLTTVQGEDINITVENDTVMVDNANVTTADIEASNGIIHVIDSVMLPPSMLEEANETETDMNETEDMEDVNDTETMNETEDMVDVNDTETMNETEDMEDEVNETETMNETEETEETQINEVITT
jgi:uncharacterized surface protein with fasciclin (FAS1) repeats